MRSRKHIYLIGALAGFIFVYLLIGLFRFNNGPTLRDFKQIVPGMTRGQVIATIGYPPGDYRSDPERFSALHSQHSLKFLHSEQWISDDGVLRIQYKEWRSGDDGMFRTEFEDRDRVAHVEAYRTTDTQRTLYSQFLEWLGW